jgi:YVTN family beta-propeller protein
MMYTQSHSWIGLRKLINFCLTLAVLGLAVPLWAAPFAYVANSGSNTVSVIDTATNMIVATIPVGGTPRYVAITPDGAFAYVTSLSSTVSVIATATKTVIATIPVVGAPYHVAITPDGAFAYVTNSTTSNVSDRDRHQCCR